MQRNAAGNFTAVFNKKKSWKGVLKKSACPWENPWSEPNASKSATFFDFAQKKVPEETSWFRITDRGIRTYGGLLDSRFATGVGWLTQWSSQVEEMSAGPNTRAGFIPAPVKGTWGKISIQYQCQEWISNNWNACLEIVYRNIVVTVFRPRGWKRSGFFGHPAVLVAVVFVIIIFVIIIFLVHSHNPISPQKMLRHGWPCGLDADKRPCRVRK